MVLRQKPIDQFPYLADACGIVEEGPLGESAVVDAHFLDDIVDVEIGDGGKGDIVEIDDEDKFLGMVGDHFVGLYHQHQVVYCIQYLL